MQSRLMGGMQPQNQFGELRRGPIRRGPHLHLVLLIVVQSPFIVLHGLFLLPADRMFQPNCHRMFSKLFHLLLAAQEPHQAHGKPPWLSLQETKTTQL
jgi:hypothetical protein